MRRRSAFTLIELLTVIAVITILGAIIVPLAGKVRNQANITKSISNLRQMGVGISMFAADNYGVLVPPGYNAQYKKHPAGKNIIEGVGWYGHLHQYVTTSDAPSDVWGDGSNDIFDLPGFEIESHWIRGYSMNKWYQVDGGMERTDQASLLRMDRILFPGKSILLAVNTDTFMFDAAWGFDRYGALGEKGPTYFDGMGTYLFADLRAEALTPDEASKYF